ncbi:MAG: antA/AntB antirepressor family protein [Clostridia bacterium]|nr:antA/AntB antirepressor family protein [Clostridia bacterium]
MDYKMIENEIIPIYENENKEQLVNARELHSTMKVGRDFTNWIKDRIKKYYFIENVDYILTIAKIGERQNVIKHDYYLTIDMAKELAIVENNEIGRKIRRYFIEVEKRYRTIIESPSNIFDFMRLAIDQIEANEKEIKNIKSLSENNAKKIEEIQSKIDVTIKKEYCLASDIAEQLKIYSERKLPHSNLVGAIARQLGYKISYKHYYEDEYIAIVTDISKGSNFWQIYYKPLAVEQIVNWFNDNRQKIEYTIVYERNTKNGVKGEIKEKGFKIDEICYKIDISYNNNKY